MEQRFDLGVQDASGQEAKAAKLSSTSVEIRTGFLEKLHDEAADGDCKLRCVLCIREI